MERVGCLKVCVATLVGPCLLPFYHDRFVFCQQTSINDKSIGRRSQRTTFLVLSIPGAYSSTRTSIWFSWGLGLEMSSSLF